MLVFAHRGYHEAHPENTLAAFAAASEMGIDGIETDLRLTADGQLVLFHDRMTHEGRTIASVTRQELSAAAGCDVPTAIEALDAFPDLIWNLEIKTPAALNASLELIQRYRKTHRLFVTSFWHAVVDEVATASDVECGLLVCHGPTQTFALQSNPSTRRSNVTSVVWCYEFLDERILEASRAAGFRNLVYGIFTPEDHRQSAEWKLDGVITDRPEFAVR